MILSTLAAMADRDNNGKFDFSASRADILKVINDLSAAGKLNVVSEKLTVGDKVVMGRTGRAFAIAAEAVEKKYSEAAIANEIIDLQSSSSSSSTSDSSSSYSSSSNSSSSYSSSSNSSSSNSSSSFSSSSSCSSSSTT